MTAVLKVLAQNGAQEITAEPHTPSPRPATKKQSRLLNFNELETLKGIKYTRQHIDRLEKEGKFPKRIKIGARIYWYEHEIDEYVVAHADARSLKKS